MVGRPWFTFQPRISSVAWHPQLRKTCSKRAVPRPRADLEGLTGGTRSRRPAGDRAGLGVRLGQIRQALVHAWLPPHLPSSARSERERALAALGKGDGRRTSGHAWPCTPSAPTQHSSGHPTPWRPKLSQSFARIGKTPAKILGFLFVFVFFVAWVRTTVRICGSERFGVRWPPLRCGQKCSRTWLRWPALRGQKCSRTSSTSSSSRKRR